MDVKAALYIEVSPDITLKGDGFLFWWPRHCWSDCRFLLGFYRSTAKAKHDGAQPKLFKSSNSPAGASRPDLSCLSSRPRSPDLSPMPPMGVRKLVIRRPFSSLLRWIGPFQSVRFAILSDASQADDLHLFHSCPWIFFSSSSFVPSYRVWRTHD